MRNESLVSVQHCLMIGLSESLNNVAQHRLKEWKGLGYMSIIWLFIAARRYVRCTLFAAMNNGMILIGFHLHFGFQSGSLIISNNWKSNPVENFSIIEIELTVDILFFCIPVDKIAQKCRSGHMCQITPEC